MKIFFLASVSFFVFCQMVVAQNSSQGFAVYLLPDSLKNETLSTPELKKLKPNGAPLIAESDIRYYQKETHSFRIDYEAAKRVKKLNDEDSRARFAVFVGNEAIYAGTFWRSTSSFSNSGIIINTYEAFLIADKNSTPDFPVLTLRTGYPTPAFFKDQDLRADSRIFNALEKAGKLYEEVELIVKCRKITATGTRRPGSEFTFDVVSVTKGELKGKEISFTLYDGELLGELGAKLGFGAGENVEFNKDQEIVLEISQQVGRAKPDFFIRKYRKK